jgi:Phosphodiester glycosidase
VITGRTPLHLLLVAGVACTSRATPVAPPNWTAAQPGLWTSEFTVEGGARAFALRFDQTRFELSLLWSPSGLHVPEDRPADTLAIWNGGYFEQDLRPSGLLLDQGRQAAPPNSGSGLIVFGHGRDPMRLVRYRDRSDLADSIASALQLWPFLIEPGGAPGIRRDDQKRAHRSAVGLDAAGRGLLLAVIDDGVSLYRLMGIARDLGAVVAANLDGGPSTGFGLSVGRAWSSPSQTLVSNALILRASRPPLGSQ